MNLNNWLCKHFDNKKKGYVTIKDVVFVCLKKYTARIVWGVFWLIVFLLLGCIFASMQGVKITREYPGSISDVVVLAVRGWSLPAVVIVVVVLVGIVLYCLLKAISRIKIAKCPLKEDDTK